MNCKICDHEMEKRGPPANAGFWTDNSDKWFCVYCRLSFHVGRQAKVRLIGWPRPHGRADEE